MCCTKSEAFTPDLTLLMLCVAISSEHRTSRQPNESGEEHVVRRSEHLVVGSFSTRGKVYSLNDNLLAVLMRK